MTLNLKIRSLQFLNLFISIYGIYYIIKNDEYVYFLISYLIFLLMCPIGISCGLHRLFSHRSYKTTIFWERFMLFFSTYATVGSSVAWVGVHRTHHSTSDRNGDPHSSYKDGNLKLSKIVSAWSGVGQEESKISISYVKDVLRDPYHKFFHTHYFKIILIPVIILYIINPIFGIFLYSLPATMSLQTTSVVNVLGHIHGYRSHETKDKSSNSWIANIISLGEGWHNNHHYNPLNYSTSEKWWEWDLIGIFIKIISTRNKN